MQEGIFMNQPVGSDNKDNKHPKDDLAHLAKSCRI
jgi:hypothetical protein